MSRRDHNQEGPAVVPAPRVDPVIALLIARVLEAESDEFCFYIESANHSIADGLCFRDQQERAIELHHAAGDLIDRVETQEGEEAVARLNRRVWDYLDGGPWPLEE